LVYPKKLRDCGISGPGRTDHECEFVGWEVEGDVCEDREGGMGVVGDGDGDGEEGGFACTVRFGDYFANVEGGLR
jgi:hypothetical protein